MTFFEYMDLQYHNCNLDIRKDEASYTPMLHAETLATKDLIDMQRSLYRKIAKIVLVFKFLKAKLTGEYPTKMVYVPPPAPAKGVSLVQEGSEEPQAPMVQST